MPVRSWVLRPSSASAGWLIAALALAGTVVCVACAAQENDVVVSPSSNAKPKGPAGTVTGTVYCADTNAPARLAQVTLIAQRGDKTGGLPNVATVDLDGHFAISKVPEGKYYVSARQPGYLDPIGSLKDKNLESLNSEARKEIEKHLIAVIISAKEPTEVSVRLERAAEIDGTVLYDDGSPAVGLHVELKATSEGAQTTQPSSHVTSVMDYAEEYSRTTDDHGRYRLLGITPGEYLVSVTVPAGSGEDVAKNPLLSMLQSSSVGALTVYFGDAFRASKAKPVKVETAGSAFTADITIPLSKLHTIRGHVVLKSTGDPPRAGGVILQYADTHETARVGIFDNSGEFAIFYVPEDSYVLEAAASPEPLPDFSEEDVGGAWGFSAMGFRMDPDPKLPGGLVSVPLLVTGDVSGITISVPDPPPITKEKGSEVPESDAIPQPAPPDQPDKP